MKAIQFTALDYANIPRDVIVRESAIIKDFSQYRFISITEYFSLLESYSCSYIESHPIVFARLFSLYTYCRALGITFIDVKVL